MYSTIIPPPFTSGRYAHTLIDSMSEFKDNIPELQDNRDVDPDRDHVDDVRAQWATARPDLDTAPVAVIARLGRATAYLDARVDAALRDFGLTREAWDLLASLRRAGP